MFVIEILEASLVGMEPFWVKQFAARRLYTKVLSGATKKFIEKLEENIAQHHLMEKLGTLHIHYKQKQQFQRALNKLDQQSKELVINAEKRCRRIKSGHTPFWP